MPERPTLHVCHVGEKVAPLHPCAKAAAALRKAGHDVDINVAAKGKPFGIGTAGTRPELKELSGQEKLPVLELADGTAIAGSREIISWARSHAPDAAAPAGQPPS